MTTNPRIASQRLTRKGALVEETYEVFRQWDEAQSFDQNIRAIQAMTFKTTAWAREVQTTIRARFSDSLLTGALITLAKGGFPLADWRHCLLLAISFREHDYWDFAENWLYPEWVAGRHAVRAEDLREFVRESWRSSRPGSPLSDYGAIRAGRDLLRMARDLGVLSGAGPKKELGAVVLGDDAFLFVCHAIAEHEGAVNRVPHSRLWHAFLLDESHVRQSLLHLHQYKRVRFEYAGSFVSLDLPCASAREFAERIVA